MNWCAARRFISKGKQLQRGGYDLGSQKQVTG
jgi:hypothetical protein